MAYDTVYDPLVHTEYTQNLITIDCAKLRKLSEDCLFYHHVADTRKF